MVCRRPRETEKALGKQDVKVKVERSRFHRLARAGFYVILAGAITAGGVLLFTLDSQDQAVALGEAMDPPMPEPGGARAWELEIPISTYSSVHTRTGNVITRIPIVGWTGAGPNMSMVLYHNAATVDSTLPLTAGMGFDLGEGWTIAYGGEILLDDDTNPTTATVIHDDGGRDIYTWNAGTSSWDSPAGVHTTMTAAQIGPTFTLDHKDQSSEVYTLVFATTAFFVSAIDPVGIDLVVSRIQHPVTSSLHMDKVTDAVGRELRFEYHATLDQLRKITDPNAVEEGSGTEPFGSTLPVLREWSFEYDGNGRLNRIINPLGHYIAIVYDATENGRITSIIDMWDNSFYGQPGPDHDYEYTYDADGRLDTVTAPLADVAEGRLTQSFLLLANEPSITRGFYTDVRGKVWAYWYDTDGPVTWPAGNLHFAVDPTGITAESFDWDADRNMIQYEDETFNIWSFVYDSNGNRLTATDPLSHIQTWTYNSDNNVTSYSDARDCDTCNPVFDTTVTFQFNDPTFPTLLTQVDEPAAGANPLATTSLEYYSSGAGKHGQLKEVIDPNGVETRFDYDSWGQQIVYAEGCQGTECAMSTSCEVDSAGRSVACQASGKFTAASGGVAGSGCDEVCSGYTSDEIGRLMAMGCLPCPLCAQTPGPDYGPSRPSPPTTPIRVADWDASLPFSYTPRGELRDHSATGSLDGNPPTYDYTRDYFNEFDMLGRQVTSSISSTEFDNTRPFTYSYDGGSGTATRDGPDDIETFTSLDDFGRLSFIRRGPSSAPVFWASYAYEDRGLLETITRSNNASTDFTFDAAQRVTVIDHRNLAGTVRKLEYTYFDNDMVETITEENEFGIILATTTFNYDERGRLISEKREPGDFYELTYKYDQGGNRTEKIHKTGAGPFAPIMTTDYHYDLEDPAAYGTKHNRLIYTELWKSGGGGSQQSSTFGGGELLGGGPGPAAPGGPGGGGPILISKTWYYYNNFGNPTRVMTRLENPEFNERRVTSTGMAYAKNGSAATYVFGEEWDEGAQLNYDITYAREFRYDTGRARYLNRELDPDDFENGTMTEVSSATTIWTDYDGDQPHGDFTAVPGSPTSTITEQRSFELGLATFDWSGGSPYEVSVKFYHTDMIGTTLMMTDSTGFELPFSAVYTAFGERVAGLANRYGYAGVHGYQTDETEDFPFQHVGARYYDPSIGRFLQRDLLGLEDGTNVYLYVGANPLIFVDPSGLQAAVSPGGAGGLLNPAAAREVAETMKMLGAMGCAGYAGKKIGDSVDPSKWKRLRPGDKLPRIRPNPKSAGHPSFYPLLAVIAIFLAYVGGQVLHRRSLDRHGRFQA